MSYAADLHSDPPIIGTAAELAEAVDAYVDVAVPFVPRARQLVIESDTGVLYVGDGVTAFSDLSPLPTPA